MKRLIYSYYGLPLALLLFSCNNRTADSEKIAKEENREMIDSLKTNASPSPSTATIPSKSDADFLVEAASGGIQEVELGKLVVNKSQSEQVKAFGSLMIRDHEEGGEKLKALAASKNIILPSSMSSRQLREKEKLSKQTQEEFDRAYITMMVNDHNQDIRKFQRAAKDATDSEIKAFAAENLPMLYMHLDSARKILKRMGPIRIPVQPPPYQ